MYCRRPKERGERAAEPRAPQVCGGARPHSLIGEPGGVKATRRWEATQRGTQGGHLAAPPDPTGRLCTSRPACRVGQPGAPRSWMMTVRWAGFRGTESRVMACLLTCDNFAEQGAPAMGL